MDLSNLEVELADLEDSAPPEIVSVTTTRIKLETPQESELPEAIHAKHHELLKLVLNHFGVNIEESQDEEVNDTELEFMQRFHTTTYKISSSHFAAVLLEIARHFFMGVKNLNTEIYQNPTLILPTGEALSNALVTAHSDIKTRSIFFGNIQGGAYISHWEVTIPNPNNSMATNFEYDRDDMIVVKFKCPETVRRENRQMKVQMYYQISIARNSIRRVIVDNSDQSNRTRLHLELNCPAVVKNGYFDNENSARKFDEPRMKRKTCIKFGRAEGQYCKDAAISDSSFFTIEFKEGIEAITIYSIVSRLRSRCGIPVEFSHFPMIDCWIWRNAPYFTWDKNDTTPTSEKNEYFGAFLNHMCPISSRANKEEKAENRGKRFAITYLIECLLSRGAVVKDQLCLNYRHWFNFLSIVSLQIRKNFDRAERSLEKLITMIDERKRFGSIHKTLILIFDNFRRLDDSPSLSNEEIKEGYQRVRKIIVTPTRLVYAVPEIMMSNRVLRKYDQHGDNILRVSFRDDDNSKMREQKVSEALMDRRVKGALIDGFFVGGKDFGYLGSSNSQMRDHGAYFLQKNDYWDLKAFRQGKSKEAMPPWNQMPQIERVRGVLGKFESIESVPKLMARLGQCFTQSRVSGVMLDRKEYCTVPDVTGGQNSLGDKFTFSDGVGCASLERAEQIAKDMNLRGCVPSCYQFRFRGMKGVVAINPELDEIAKWSSKTKIVKDSPTAGDAQSWNVHFTFRDSQIKFRGALQPSIEIVKFSSPCPVCLNKPFMNILDQVSEKQGRECHRRVMERIEELYDLQIRGLATMMIDENQCRNKLKELPRRVDIDCLSIRAGFELSREPFFRGLIKASIKYSITKHLRKQQIEIPFEMGRTMLGVIDETGQLQYGQIFVQYHKGIRDKFPPIGAAKGVLKGTVMVTKNPCIVEGDVRLFEAVDIPELRHLVDVIVFPRYGPRSHPDEMAGSDLDGDEYCVIWNQGLFFNHNEPPFDFAVPKRIDENITENLQAKMAEFYVNYMKLDAVGTISNAFQFNSDLYGISHPVCKQLAKKICEAVDFTKSGLPPKNLTRKWKKDPDGNDIPPEKPEIVPDFSFGDQGKPVYESRRLMGKLYRKIKVIDDVLGFAEDRDKQMVIELDDLLIHPGWEAYRAAAEQELSKYNTLLRTMMESYGIRTESEIISGYINEMRNRISDKDQDDMSFFNTNQVIETRVSNLFRRFREEFFEEFGSWKIVLAKIEKPFADENNVCHYECTDPTAEMKMKAVAYYRVCYEKARDSGEKKLSFGWLAYDILAHVKQQEVLKRDDYTPHGNPLFVKLKDHMKKYVEENSAKFEEFKNFSSKISGAEFVLKKYCDRYEGLDQILFLITEWGSVINPPKSYWKPHHLPLLALLYFTNFFPSMDGDALTIIDPIPLDSDEKPESSQKLPHPERSLLKFFEFLSSKKFSKATIIDFEPLGVKSIFRRGEWISIHWVGLRTYYNLVFNLRFEELPLEEERENNLIIREYEPFVIELPDEVNLYDVTLQLQVKTGVDEVQLRRQRNGSIRISARGTIESFDRLRKITIPRAPVNPASLGEGLIDQLRRLVYEKIMSDY